MRFSLSAILLTALSVIPVYALAKIPEFLVPVTKSEEAAVRKNNDYFLKKETYFAKRHRIVTVNTHLLEHAEQISISLFDDVSVTLEAISVDTREDGLAIMWKGRFSEPTVSVEDIVAEGVLRQEAEILHPLLTSLRISAAQISFDEKTGTKYQYNFAKFSLYKNGDSRRPDSGSTSLYDVGFTIDGILLDGVYKLRPLAADPRHHVLIELDPEKVFATPIEPPSSGEMPFVEDAENRAKREQYRQFIDSLGPDPRPSDIHVK